MANGLAGDTLRIVAENGTKPGYVRNRQANQRVRVRVREGRNRTAQDGRFWPAASPPDFRQAPFSKPTGHLLAPYIFWRAL